MEQQKIENLLLTAFEATQTQREKSPELEVSYEPSTKRWEVVIRYVQDIRRVISEYTEVEAEYLIGNYGILRGSKEDLLAIARRDEVLYMEAAKRLFFAWEKGEIEGQQILQGVSGLDSICLTRDFNGEENINGKGVYMAYLDSGIDYRHPEFIDWEGKTRIAFLWDQTKAEGVYSREEIQRALEAAPEEGYEIVGQRDLSGHGTHVAAIGSGNTGVAPGSELLVVKLGTPTGGGAKTTELMRGVNACVNYAVERNRPLALNISYGTNYGAHNGYGILEQYLSDAVGYGRNTFVVGAGNEGVGAGHFQVSGEEIRERRDGQGGDAYEIELAVGDYQQSFSLQIWKSYGTNLRFYLLPAGGDRPIEILPEMGAVTYESEGMEALIFYGEPSPFSPYQEIYMDFIPKDTYLPAGIWKIFIEDTGREEEESYGTVDLWLPVSETLALQTGFLRPSPEKTLTIPATASGVLSVGAYDQRYNQVAPFSGRGYTWATNQVKPDLVAPGVEIVSASPQGGYTARSGSSMAAPFVTGATALFMEWGIVREADPYMYGEKMKAYLIHGANRLPGVEIYPNSLTGWGTLCIGRSIP